MNELVNYMHSRIRKNKNFLQAVCGHTGSGKSYWAVGIGAVAHKAMTGLDFNIDQCVFSGKELMALIRSNVYPPGSVFIWDEIGVGLSAREWHSVGNKMIGFLLQTFRHRNYVVLFTTPDYSFIDSQARKMIHSYAEMATIDRIANRGIAKVYMMQTNKRSGKVYYKYLRVKLGNQMVKIARIGVPLLPQPLRDEYENKKTDFTDKLNRRIEKELDKINPDEDKVKPLTEIQQRVVNYHEQGYSVLQTAKQMDIDQSTVSHYRRLIRKKGYEFLYKVENGRRVPDGIQKPTNGTNGTNNPHSQPNLSPTIQKSTTVEEITQ